MAASPIAEDLAASAEPPAFSFGRHGLIAAWPSPLGPVVARFERFGSEAPVLARALGRPGARLTGPVVLARGEDGLDVAWCDEAGAWHARYQVERGSLSVPALRLPGAVHAALGGGYLFGVDAEGITARRVVGMGSEEYEDAPIVRVVAEQRAGFVIATDAVRDEAVLVFTHPDDRLFGVASLADGEPPRVVRHSIDRRASALRVRAVGGRAAVLIGTDGGGISHALLAKDAKLVERPHDVLPVGIGAIEGFDVVWTDDRWTALAREAAGGALHVIPIGDREPRFTLPRSGARFAADYFGQCFFAAEVEPRGDDVELVVWRVEADGSAPQRRAVIVRAEDASERRIARDVKATFALVAARVASSAGYRTRAQSAAEEGDGLTLYDEGGTVSVRARAEVDRASDVASVALRVSLGPGEPDGELGEVPGSLVRLAQWMRERWDADARRQREERARWAAEEAAKIGGLLEDVAAAGPNVELTIGLAELPSADELERWVRGLRRSMP
ncbi:MAG: hypothetical protein AB7S26_14155 [Sandaracinaceae bacterium]